jgi:hypothetical protein
VILEVWRHTAVGVSEWLDVVRPPPPRFELEPADLFIADRDDLGPAVGNWRTSSGVVNDLCSVVRIALALLTTYTYLLVGKC